jgi:glutaredoxin
MEANHARIIVIIFSKSYCPHSRRAKDILLEKYIIDPAPFVVELDQHPLGAGLQARLAELTGRRTVPNVLVNAVSIGGGDDVAELDVTKQLVWKVQDLAGKKVTVKQRPIVEEEGHGLR